MGIEKSQKTFEQDLVWQKKHSANITPQLYSLFSYKKGNSFLHRCPAWIKLLFVPVLNILCWKLPLNFSLALIILQTVIAFCLNFTLREQLCDIKPVIYYSFMLFLVKVISDFSLLLSNHSFSIAALIAGFSWHSEKESLIMLIKLFCLMQTSSLIFKTSTSIELRQGISCIPVLRLLAEPISMFLNFIPMVSKIWRQLKISWKARGGKESLKMYVVLFPVLFSTGMKKAWNLSRAISIRK